MNSKTGGSLVFTREETKDKREKKPPKNPKEKKQSGDSGRRNWFILDVNYLFMSNIVISKHWKMQSCIYNNEKLISRIK